MRVGAVIGLIGAGLLLAGCGSGDVTGEASPEGVAAGEPVFSPCDAIPDEALIELGLDPATESPDIMGVAQPGWKICKWQGSGPALGVAATTHTMDDVQENKRNIDFNPVEIAGRQGFTYRETTDRDRRNCDVALASGNGAVIISVAYLGVDQVLEEPCSVVVRRAAHIAQYIPD
ncbi:DUF3558 domain-containing protein [Prescottella agglutinans]|uniref:DUF3558 domain-containing protein n=1 Tax=Prescottella agglutinans TaxID=1644129 RepID=A0A3S3E8L5_9NOCA|nr:DUF3558 domain-containing protein [Prescottella agglutinans]RVW08241.1 DUF3558 domain-containing protein [Prescottella agglutinans]